MPDIRFVRLPIDYIHLARSGIDSLYAQIVDTVETSRTTTQKGIAAMAGARLGLRNLIVKLLSGFEGEVSAEVTGSRAQTEESTRVTTVEHRLAALLGYLSEFG